ncbi:MAG: CPBP family intramembrane metalloprotease [Lachnospiraceae bacterium]|nr:CPBP family intramembrane metalloprotease [Lachnospiraceae bacterium]
MVTDNINSYYHKHTRTVVMFMVITLFVQQLVLKFFQIKTKMPAGPRNAYITTKILIVFLAVMMVIYVNNTTMKINYKDILITKEEMKRTLIRAGIISIFMILTMIVIRIVKGYYNPKVAERPYFKLYLTVRTRWFYPVNAFLQEVFIKAFMQDNIRIMAGKDNIHYTVWLTSLYFFVLHMSYPLYYMVIAGMFCVATGYFYEKNRNIWGCALLHFVIGFMPRALGIL